MGSQGSLGHDTYGDTGFFPTLAPAQWLGHFQLSILLEARLPSSLSPKPNWPQAFGQDDKMQPALRNVQQENWVELP